MQFVHLSGKCFEISISSGLKLLIYDIIKLKVYTDAGFWTNSLIRKLVKAHTIEHFN